jgi:4-oxalocrotonate tautomerase family enzyme
MPSVQITIMPQSLEKKTEMSRVITNEINRITGIPKDAITIAFYELPAESFATNGEMLSERFKRLNSK